MPYGGGPKSGCAPRLRPMKSMKSEDDKSTGAPETSWFHQLSAGNGERPPRSSLRMTGPADCAPPAFAAGVGDAGLLPWPQADITAKAQTTTRNNGARAL